MTTVAASGLVTLLTDFGTSDTYVAEMKAAMLRIEPSIRFIDITHEIAPGDVNEARYCLDRTWSRFPAGTVHLVVVDPGVGTARRALAARRDGHGFVAPDNGVLAGVVQGTTVVALPVPDGASATFHGRDVFAPAAARLAIGEALEALGSPCAHVVEPHRPAPQRDGDTMVGHVVHVDRFGNLVTDIVPDGMPERVCVVVAGHETRGLRRTFGEVELGQLVAYVGSAGTIEVAVRDGSATRMLGVGRGTAVKVSLA